MLSKILYLTSVSLCGYCSGVFINRWKTNSLNFKLETVSATDIMNGIRLEKTWITEIGHPEDEERVNNQGYFLCYDYLTRIPRWTKERIIDEQFRRHQSPADDQTEEERQPIFNSVIYSHLRGTKEDYPSLADTDGPDDKIEHGYMASPCNHNADGPPFNETLSFSNAAPVYRGHRIEVLNNTARVVRQIVWDHDIGYLMTGPLFLPELENGQKILKYQVFGENKVAMPTHFFRLVMYWDRDDDEWKRMIGKTRNTGYGVHNTTNISLEEFESDSGLEFRAIPEFDKVIN